MPAAILPMWHSCWSLHCMLQRLPLAPPSASLTITQLTAANVHPFRKQWWLHYKSKGLLADPDSMELQRICDICATNLDLGPRTSLKWPKCLTRKVLFFTSVLVSSSANFAFWLIWYCWCKKSCTWDVWNPVNNGINFLSTGAGFLPSTVSYMPTKDHYHPIFGATARHVATHQLWNRLRCKCCSWSLGPTKMPGPVSEQRGG